MGELAESGGISAGMKDRNIGVAITSEGKLAHFRRGHHRLAAAQVLNLEIVPVEISFISGAYSKIKISVWDLHSNLRPSRA